MQHLKACFYFSRAMLRGFPFGSSNLSIVLIPNKKETPNANIRVKINETVMAIQMPLVKNP